MLTQELINALTEHLRNGYSEDQLRTETLKAGYDEATFQQAITSARENIQTTTAPPSSPPLAVSTTPSGTTTNEPAPPPTQAPTPPTGMVAHAPQASTTAAVTPPQPTTQSASQPALVSSKEESSAHRFPFVPVVIGVMLLLLLIGGTTYAMMAGINPFRSVTQLFGSAPYSQETFLQDVIAGVASIESSGFGVAVEITTTDTIDSDVYPLPPALESELEYPYQGLGLLPTDLQIQGSLQGRFVEMDGDESRGYGQVQGSFETPDLTVAVDLEGMVSQLNGVFVRINRFPSSLFLDVSDVSDVRGQWLHVFDEPIEESLAEQSPRVAALADNEADQAVVRDQLQRALRLADEYQLVTPVGNPVTEEVDGKRAYRYDVVINWQELASFFGALRDEFVATYGDDSPVADVADEELAVYFEPLETQAFAEYVNRHMQFSIWATSQGVPVQFAIANRIAIDSSQYAPGSQQYEEMRIQESLERVPMSFWVTASSTTVCDSLAMTSLQDRASEFSWPVTCVANEDTYAIHVELPMGSYCVDGDDYNALGTVDEAAVACTDQVIRPPAANRAPEPTPDRQVNSRLTLTLTDVNQPTPIELPADALSPDEVVEKLPILNLVMQLDDARNDAQDAAIRASVNNVRVEAELYYSDNTTYQGLCDTLRSTSSQPIAALAETSFECLDAENSYAFAAALLSGGYYCVDSQGVAQMITEQITTTACVPTVVTDSADNDRRDDGGDDDGASEVRPTP